MSPVNPKDSEGARDRAALAAAAAAAQKNSKDVPASDLTVAGSNADDFVRARAQNTPPGAARDYAQLRAADAVKLPEHAYDPAKTDDGTRITSAQLLPNSEQSRDYTTARYEAAQHDAIARDHAARLQRSGKVDPNSDLGIPKV